MRNNQLNVLAHPAFKRLTATCVRN